VIGAGALWYVFGSTIKNERMESLEKDNVAATLKHQLEQLQLEYMAMEKSNNINRLCELRYRMKQVNEKIRNCMRSQRA
jgi:hypothetical protein